jgi:MFS family permease
MSRTHPEESLGANPADAALNPADSVAMGVPSSRAEAAASDTADSRRQGTFHAFAFRPFRLLFAAFLINQTGFWISHLSLQGLIVDLTDNDPLQSGLLFFALFSPAFVLAPLAGVAADRFDRKRIVLVCYAGISLACALLTVLSAQGLLTPGIVLAVSAAMGVAFAFSGPANFAIAANTVPMEALPSAVSLQSAANNLTRVVGPLLAAPMLATHRYDVSFSIYLVAASVAGFLTWRMRIEKYAVDSDESGIWSRIRSGFDHAREREPALPALSVVAILSLFGVSHVVLLPVYCQDVLADPKYFAWLVAVSGLGAMAGALRTGQMRKAITLRSASLGLFAYGGALTAFALSSTVTPALCAQLVAGYFYFSVMTKLQTLLQQLVDESKRGRIMSLFQIAWAGLVPFGSLAMGYLARPLGTTTTLMAAGIVCLIYGATISVFSSRWSADAASAAARRSAN